MMAVEAVKEKFYCFLGIVHPTYYQSRGWGPWLVMWRLPTVNDSRQLDWVGGNQPTLFWKTKCLTQKVSRQQVQILQHIDLPLSSLLRGQCCCRPHPPECTKFSLPVNVEVADIRTDPTTFDPTDTSYHPSGSPSSPSSINLSMRISVLLGFVLKSLSVFVRVVS